VAFLTLTWFSRITEHHNLQELLKEHAAESSQFQRFSLHQTTFYHAKNSHFYFDRLKSAFFEVSFYSNSSKAAKKLPVLGYKWELSFNN
jgi:hypothetical protein